MQHKRNQDTKLSWLAISSEQNHFIYTIRTDLYNTQLFIEERLKHGYL